MLMSYFANQESILAANSNERWCCLKPRSNDNGKRDLPRLTLIAERRLPS
jgi:hypothetical protein